jgi:hypothetical protein
MWEQLPTACAEAVLAFLVSETAVVMTSVQLCFASRAAGAVPCSEVKTP